MRDLASRLRQIVRQDREAQADAQTKMRDLTYVPTIEGGHAAERIAEVLNGSVHQIANSACAVFEHAWDADHSHGRRRVGSYGLGQELPLGLFDARAGAVPDWASRVVFFDVETTGLSGGAGMLAFLVGCGWFENGGFKVRQFLLGSASGERALLDALGRVFDEASLVVTFNGRTFDVPLMETRWAFHRSASPTDDLPHFDMLPPARRLWGKGKTDIGCRFSIQQGEKPTPDVGFSCSLTSLERSVLGFHRVGDVGGFEIPLRYFQFLRSGDAGLMEGVLEHNRLDLLSTAAVMCHALGLAQEGPDACRDEREQLGLGRLYERAGDRDRAVRAYELAARETSPDRDVRRQALARLAYILRREARFDEAADAWHRVLSLAEPESYDALERRAVEALAIHHEHRARDLASARRYAQALRSAVTGQARADADHRLVRIDRKLKAADPEKDVGSLFS
jgi:uncharacterized protein YprB with RNaseH-like and TPR domain